MLRVENLKKVYRSGQSDLVLFENLSFRVRKGEMLAIVGESGAGKSTLLHILGALDSASEGDVYCAAMKLRSLSDDAAAEFRNNRIGFVWQFHYLLPEFTAAENVAMPLLMRGKDQSEAEREALTWLREVGLEDRAHHRSGELSGGEQQRVALARALIARLHREHQLTSLIVTHNHDFARRCDRVLRMAGGKVEELSPESLPA
jgi:lipoprotein-releasing system ATP-binding protein